MSGGTVGIVGLGLVGGSLALDLVDRDIPVVAVDTEPGHRLAAEQAGIGVATDLSALAAAAQLVVVAVPPAAVASVLADVAALAPQTTLTDVASVKTPTALGLDVAPVRWIGGHPMAGTERTGFAAARRGLLAGAPWMLTPSDAVDVADLLAVVDLVLAVDALPVVVDPAEHDRLVAAVSHVTHLLAYALHGVAGGLGRETVDLVAGPSFRDATRVAASDPAFWADLTHRNRDAVAEVLTQVQTWLTDSAGEDAEALTARLTAARRRPSSPAPHDVPVELDDVPAALARLRRLGAQGYVVAEVDRGGGHPRVRMRRR